LLLIFWPIYGLQLFYFPLSFIFSLAAAFDITVRGHGARAALSHCHSLPKGRGWGGGGSLPAAGRPDRSIGGGATGALVATLQSQGILLLEAFIRAHLTQRTAIFVVLMPRSLVFCCFCSAPLSVFVFLFTWCTFL
jgi:hypothetical protein